MVLENGAALPGKTVSVVRGGKRLMKKKNIKYILLSLVIAVAGIFAFGVTDKGSLLWGVTAAHKTETIYDMDTEVSWYNENYEKTYEQIAADDGAAACYASPWFTENKLFGKKCKYIIYGEVLKSENYLMQTETQAYYACHLLTVRVENSIYGGIRKKKKINILCRWMYKEDNLDAAEIGEKGIFIIHGKPTLLCLEGSAKKLLTIGNMQRYCYYQYCMDSEKEGLDKLKSKQDVIDYWRREEMINTELEEE